MLEEGVLTTALTGYYDDMTDFAKRVDTASAVYAENFARSIPDVRLTETVSLPAHGLPPWPGDVATLTEELRPLLHNGYFCAVLAGTPRAAKALVRDLDAAGISVQLAKRPGEVQPAAGAVAVLSGRAFRRGRLIPPPGSRCFTSRRHDVSKSKGQKEKRRHLQPYRYQARRFRGAPEPWPWVCTRAYNAWICTAFVKDYLKISYDKADTLYVPVTQLDLLSRYTAPGDGEKGGSWPSLAASSGPKPRRGCAPPPARWPRT